MKNKQKAFTVMELLVVIAIMGLLTSVVLVSIKGARERAKKAKVIQFSTSIQHALGAYIVGEWKFENTTSDTSGHNYTITEHGMIQYETNDYSPHLGKAAIFAGSCIEVDDDTPDKGPLDIEGTITIEVWLKAYAFNDYNIVVIKDENYHLFFDTWQDGLYFNLDGVAGNVVAPYSYFSLDEWHHVAATYNGSKIQIFVDGEEVDSQNASGPISFNSVTPLYLGCHMPLGGGCPGGCYFQGPLDEIRIYEEGLTSAQIKQHYVEGAKKRGLLARE